MPCRTAYDPDHNANMNRPLYVLKICIFLFAWFYFYLCVDKLIYLLSLCVFRFYLYKVCLYPGCYISYSRCFYFEDFLFRSTLLLAGRLITIKYSQMCVIFFFIRKKRILWSFATPIYPFLNKDVFSTIYLWVMCTLIALVSHKFVRLWALTLYAYRLSFKSLPPLSALFLPVDNTHSLSNVIRFSTTTDYCCNPHLRMRIKLPFHHAVVVREGILYNMSM